MKKGFGGVFTATFNGKGVYLVVHLVDSKGKQYGMLPWGQIVGLDKLD